MPSQRKPRLTTPKSKKMLSDGDTQKNQSRQQKIREQTLRDYQAQKPIRVSNIMGLTDATGSMDSMWAATKKHINEVIQRISDIGEFNMNWVAFRDYCDGDDLLEASGWSHSSKKLQKFIGTIQCFGGGDYPEAIEYGLEYASKDERATRILLIGDAPPHPERDYIKHAEALAQLKRPVYCFVVGSHHETIKTFEEIARITGGECTTLTSADDILDMVVLTAADDIGGSEAVTKYLKEFTKNKQLSASATRFANKLLRGKK